MRYESSTPTSQELSSSIFQCLWVRHLCHLTRSPLFQYLQAYRPCTDRVPPRINRYHPILTQCHHCCSILTQCTSSSPRNAQLSQLDLWLILSLLLFCQMIFSPILGWLSNKIGKIRPVRAFLSKYLTNSSFMVLNVLKMIESDFLHQTVSLSSQSIQ